MDQSGEFTPNLSTNPLLSVEDLRLHFRTGRGVVQAVDGVTFSLDQNQTVVVIGESGCGKSSLMRAILRLLPRNVNTYSGRVLLDGVDIMEHSDERFRQEIRWVKTSFVPQAAMNSLNPVVRVGEQVAEPLIVHKLSKSKAEALGKAEEAFRLVGIPTDFLNRYPFELSGGMRQRVATAMALITQPRLVILDEPTSALDVLTQANMMNLFKRLKRDIGAGFILITHDIATSSEVADQVAVMYAGQVVEFSQAKEFFREPLHPYAKGLMASVPALKGNQRLDFVPGQPPSLVDPPSGCRFADRCPARFAKCDQEPPTFNADSGREVKCWLYQDVQPAQAPPVHPA